MPRPKPTPRQVEARKRKARRAAKRWYYANRDRAKKRSLAYWHSKARASRQAPKWQKELAAEIGGHLTNGRNLDTPFLRWLGADGTLHIERELSAEALIRAWKKKNA